MTTNNQFDLRVLAEAIQKLGAAVDSQQSTKEALQRNVYEQLKIGLDSERKVLNTMKNAAAINKKEECNNKIREMEDQIDDLQGMLAGELGEKKENLSTDIEAMSHVFKKFVEITKERTNVAKEISQAPPSAQNEETLPTQEAKSSCCIS